MTRLEEIEHAVKKLGSEELARFREWFRDYDADQWDRQIEDDVRAGKLDRLAEEALAEHKSGRTTKL